MESSTIGIDTIDTPANGEMKTISMLPIAGLCQTPDTVSPMMHSYEMRKLDEFLNTDLIPPAPYVETGFPLRFMVH